MICVLPRQFDSCRIFHTLRSFSVTNARDCKNFAFLKCVISLLRKVQRAVPIYVGFEHTWRFQVLVAEDTLVSSAGINELKASANTRVSV